MIRERRRNLRRIDMGTGWDVIVEEPFERAPIASEVSERSDHLERIGS
jgi:hypothetical protein